MSDLIWCAVTLSLLYVIGGGVFSWLERDAELEHQQKNRFLYDEMRDLYEFDKCSDEIFKTMEFCKNQKQFNAVLEEFLERNGNEMQDHKKWTFFGSAFFVSTLITTLGFGNFHPRTPGGQMFTVIFGLIGIPVMGYVLSSVGRGMVSTLMPVCKKLETQTRQLVVLSILMIIFILMGGLLFKNLEGWSFLEACYFSTCTLMTVGFGDYLPSYNLSRLCTTIFILFGLGTAASFIALLQIQVQIRGEHFAKHLDSWYGAITNDGAQPGAAGVSLRDQQHSANL